MGADLPTRWRRDARGSPPNATVEGCGERPFARKGVAQRLKGAKTQVVWLRTPHPRPRPQACDTVLDEGHSDAEEQPQPQIARTHRRLWPTTREGHRESSAPSAHRGPCSGPSSSRRPLDLRSLQDATVLARTSATVRGEGLLLPTGAAPSTDFGSTSSAVRARPCAKPSRPLCERNRSSSRPRAPYASACGVDPGGLESVRRRPGQRNADWSRPTNPWQCLQRSGAWRGRATP